MTSIRARLTVVLLVVVGAVLLVLAVALYVAVREAAWRQHDAGLAARALALATITEAENGDYELDLPAMQGAYVEVWRPDGRVLLRSPGWTGDLPAQVGPFDLTLPDGRRGRAFGVRFAPRHEGAGLPGELLLVLAAGIEPVEAAGGAVRTRFIAFGLLALAMIGTLTAGALARGLRPLDELTAALTRIDDRHLGARITLEQQPDELAVPVQTLNELLDRLAHSFARERQFTANVSHELRTPLAGLRTLLEVSARAPRPGDHDAALAIVVQMCSLVESLLMLARLDAGQLEVARDRVELRRLVEDCWAPHAAAATARGLVLRNEVSAATVVASDRDKLRIVVANLVANAVEYTDPGGWIEICSGSGAVLEVIDSGPPIPPEQLERIFDRMWRGDAARSAAGQHCGIGLALARAMAERLDLALTADIRSDGTVRFLLAPAL